MFKKMMIFAAAFAATLMSQALSASTTTLQADGLWNTFDVDNTTSATGGIEWIDLADGSVQTFQFTLVQPGVLKVVDGGFAGDVYVVSSNGAPIGATSAAVNSYPNSVGLDFDAAWADNTYSRAVYSLNPGTYSITGAMITTALDDSFAPLYASVGAVSLTAVPLPAAWGLFLAGSGLLGAISRRRRSN